MVQPVAKGPQANVRDIATAKSRGGRPSGPGYDPATGVEHQPKSTNNETDVFDLVGQRGYSEDRFYIKSSNDHDHSAELRVRVPKGIDSQIHAAVNDVPEYRNQQDFWRDAGIHRLEYLQKRYSISDEGRRMLELERLRSDSERRERDVDMMTETVVELTRKLVKLWDTQDYGMLAKELEEGQELIDWMREPYRSQIKGLISDWHGRARQKIEEYNASMDD